MKIVTVNVPESYVGAIEKLIGEGGLFSSRSELIRCAVREFLIKELKMAKIPYIVKYDKSEFNDFDEENFVRVPVKNEKKEEPIREFKTYKIVRRLT